MGRRRAKPIKLRRRSPEAPGVWWLDLMRNGERIRESLDTASEDVALRRARLRLTELDRIDAARDLGIDEFLDISLVDIARITAEYELELMRRGRTEQHRRDTMACVLRLLKAMKAQTLMDVTVPAVRAALTKVCKSNNAQNKYRDALGRMFRWLIKEGRFGKNPCAAIETAKHIKRKQRPIDRAGLLRLFEVSPPHRSLVYTVAAGTGLRRGELDALPWADVDLDERVIYASGEITKNDRHALMPIPEFVAQVWRCYLDHPVSFKTNVVRGRAATIWTQRILERRALPTIPRVETFRQDLKAAGIQGPEDFFFHDLRSSFVTNMSRAGVSLTMAKDLARHSTIVLTADLYTRLESTDRRRAVDRIDAYMTGEDKSGQADGRATG